MGKRSWIILQRWLRDEGFLEGSMGADFVECQHDSAKPKQVWFPLAALAILLVFVLATVGEEKKLRIQF